MNELKKGYTQIIEAARLHLGISRDDYALCSYIQYRSADPRQDKPGWCCDEKTDIAKFVGITRQGLYKMCSRLCAMDLIEAGGAVPFGWRVTEKWIDTENECKQSLHDGVNKVYTPRKQSLHDGVNKVYVHNKVENKLKNKREEEETAAAEISNFPLNEKPLSQTNGAAPPSTLIEVHDPETPGATIYDAVPTVEPPPNRINLYDRPNAKTPAELQEALSKFYVEFENEWSAGVLENSKGRRYPKERRTEIVRAFCCHAIKSNRGGDTFQMLNADLQAWFLRQPEFERTQPATNNKNSAVYEPPRNAVY